MIMRNTSSNGKKVHPEKPISVEMGSGNVFADLGFPQPEIALAKAKLVQRIRDVIAQRKLTQAEAAALLGLDQPKVSALVRGRVAGYSLDRLFKFLNLHGQRVEISVQQASSDANSASTCVVV